MKTKLLLILSLAILATVFARSTENKPTENQMYDQYELAIDEITRPITLVMRLFETCSPNQISFDDGPWFIFERLYTNDCKVSISNLVRHLPSISRSLSVISKRFLRENQPTEKGEF